jgi:Fe-S oxidoreductase
MFQVIRNMHVAGRCTDCGECQRACPVGIPLRGLTRDMYDSVGELFCFKSGMDINQQPLLTAYEVSEAEQLMG